MPYTEAIKVFESMAAGGAAICVMKSDEIRVNHNWATDRGHYEMYSTEKKQVDQGK